MTRCRLRSTGSLGSVPRLRHYNAALRLPALPQSSLLLLALTYPSLDGRAQDLPGSWTTLRQHAAFSDPGDPLHLDRRAKMFLSPIMYAAMLPSTWTSVSASRRSFRGSITRPASPLSTLRSRDLARPRKTRFPAVVVSRRSGISPTGCYDRFQLSHPPFPGFSWRNVHGQRRSPYGERRLAQARLSTARGRGPSRDQPPPASERSAKSSTRSGASRTIGGHPGNQNWKSNPARERVPQTPD